MSKPTSKPDYGHAVVIGAGMAGLFAARVLTDHFGRVTVVDRDRLADASEFRSGVPQGRHLHILLRRGHGIIQKLFPDLEAELDAVGVPLLNVGLDIEAVMFGNQLPRYQSQHDVRSSSRVWLETCVRRRLKAERRVEFVEETEVTGLSTSSNGDVNAIELRKRGDGKTRLAADLVVDASGRSSKAFDWLAALGYETPKITAINASLGYATRWYRRPRHARPWQAVLLGALPTSNSRAGALFPVEDDRWVVTLVGIAHQQPPTDDAGFLEFARHLVAPTIYDAIREAEPISPVYGYRRTDNRWMHFERLARWPERFIVLGDAACCFNPVYGQGITVSAIEATLLDRLLRRQGRDLRGLCRRFQARLPEALQGAWLLSTGEDFRWPTTQGGKPSPATRVVHWYVDRLMEILPKHELLREAFVSVQHLLEPPATLFRPAVLRRVLAHVVRSYAQRYLAARAPALHEVA
jgi:2-polyprenyl-6-methoxyphenol hydroxylase-like FAD-dependent oxidoreductase